jgi:hypothetical protein
MACPSGPPAHTARPPRLSGSNKEGTMENEAREEEVSAVVEHAG